jgi:hypothetical protein
MAYRRDLKFCGMLHWHLEVCILLRQKDPIFFLWVMVDPRGMTGVKKLVFTFPYRKRSRDLKLCTMPFSFGDVYIVGMGGSNYESCWIQEGLRVWNSLCSFLFLDGQLERLETLLNNLLSFVDVHTAKMGGSSFFSELWWIHTGGGCETADAHFSY